MLCCQDPSEEPEKINPQVLGIILGYLYFCGKFFLFASSHYSVYPLPHSWIPTPFPGSFLAHPFLCPPLLLPPTPRPLFLSSRSFCPVSCDPSLSGPQSLPPSFSTFCLRPTDFLLVSFLFFFKEFLDEMRRGLKGAPGSPRLGENLGRSISDHRQPLNLICSLS